MRMFGQTNGGKPLPPCTCCGKPTANFKSRMCETCKGQRLAEGYGMGDVLVAVTITGEYPNAPAPRPTLEQYRDAADMARKRAKGE